MNEENILKVGSNEMELVDFRIFKEDKGTIYEGIYGVNVSKVREIIKLPTITKLPSAPKYVDGIFDLRGVVIPVVNLAKWMNTTIPESKVKEINERIIITEFNHVLIGFLVHEARRIRRVNWGDIETTSFSSDEGAFANTKITGITKIEDNEVLLILDLETIIEDLGFYTPSVDVKHSHIEKFSGTALILDDSTTARKLVKNALIDMGFNVVDVVDGVEGLKKLDEMIDIFGENISNELKVIVSDVEMPQMDGFTFASNVKKNNLLKDIPLLFNSSISDHFSDIRGKEAGADAYLTKFDASLFYKEVADVLNKHSIKNKTAVEA
jgi:two-component system chemotaxis response regulator CheV